MSEVSPNQPKRWNNELQTASDDFWCRLIRDVDEFSTSDLVRQTHAYQRLEKHVNLLISERRVDPVTIMPIEATDNNGCRFNDEVSLPQYEVVSPDNSVD